MIPIQNIYYLLCYAWDRFDEGDMRDVSGADFQSIADLLAAVLCRGINRLLRKGLDRGYREQEEIIKTVRGRIEIGYTVRHGLHRRGRALCRFDELEHDVLHNRILKSTLHLLLRMDDLDGEVKRDVWGLCRRLTNIGVTELTQSIFGRITIHRNNSDYRFLLHICELIVAYSLPDEKSGSYRFREFLRDETRMRYLFQQFVLNFLGKELPWRHAICWVGREYLKWPADESYRISDLDFLPRMETDVSLRFPNRTLIIDTKYVPDLLVSKYGGRPKVRSENLYQINMYLNSLLELPDRRTEGILLYPTNGVELDLAWKIRKHVVRVRTLDLGCHWRNIHDNLLDIVGVDAEDGEIAKY
jgi:5-methylcytosine-specific restriction enzyme subunit McrC